MEYKMQWKMQFSSQQRALCSSSKSLPPVGCNRVNAVSQLRQDAASNDNGRGHLSIAIVTARSWINYTESTLITNGYMYICVCVCRSLLDDEGYSRQQAPSWRLWSSNSRLDITPTLRLKVIAKRRRKKDERWELAKLVALGGQQQTMRTCLPNRDEMSLYAKCYFFLAKVLVAAA